MIRFLALDIDGTLTDGKIYIGNQGELMKAFNVKDGYALKEQLPQLGITPIIITARQSEMVNLRCRELGISHIYQGVRNKLECLRSIVDEAGASLADVAYMGDDILDLLCMNPIRQMGGLAGCPADATPQVAVACNFIATHKAGEGAVREFVEYIISRQEPHSSSLNHRLEKAIAYIEGLNYDSLSLGRHEVSPDFYFNVMQYTPSPQADVPYESHRQYIDIQRLIEGEELFFISDTSRLQPISPYDREKDCINYTGDDASATLHFRPNTCLVLFPKDAHKAARLNSAATPVKKIVGKLKIADD